MTQPQSLESATTHTTTPPPQNQKIAEIMSRVEQAQQELESQFAQCSALQKQVMRSIQERIRQHDIASIRQHIQSLS